MSFTIDGLRVGHAEDRVGLTGCTVLIMPPGTKGGGSVRGGAPGSRETDLLDPKNLVEEVNAFVLSGGSAFGLAAADGVVRYLEEHDMGFETGAARIPIVPAAVIFDLGVGSADVRPDAGMGYKACVDAGGEIMRQGNVGAGMGATLGMVMGPSNCTKSGLGTACFEGDGGLKLFALAVVNAFGDVIDERGEIIAGARDSQGGFLDTEAFLESTMKGGSFAPMSNTTIGAIVTNARLSKTDVNWVASVGHNGLARAIRPSHTKLDGDAIFAAATGKVEASPDLVGIVGTRIMAEAIRAAVRSSRTVAGIPAHEDLIG
ncbi:MAG: P1 family peptidase [Actinomycetota bacterium]|nr:P1 family peptidase [Actinomycetota bacterium]